MSELRSVEWTGAAIRLIDQTALPGTLAYAEVRTVDELVSAIQRLVVRGAPAIAVAGAYGVELARRAGGDVDAAVARIRGARPTAVNLAVAVDEVAAAEDALLAAKAVEQAEVDANLAMGRFGADWLVARLGERPLRLLTHCNTGTFATPGQGTALGIIRELHRRGLVERVHVDETRPLLQGARLTAWELGYDGIPHVVQADSVAAGEILRGQIDAAIVGADRVAANGDVANKIGTVGVALACGYAQVPFVVAAPTTTVDVTTASGADIHIEQRAGAEVVAFNGIASAPVDSVGYNPAFDVTPADLVTALVTERGVREVSAGQLPQG